MSSLLQKPDFLCIGFPKTGTSWLYYQFRQRPEFGLPPVKEIRYFCEGDIFPAAGLATRFLSAHWHYRGNYQKLLKSMVAKSLRQPSHLFTSRWQWNYLLAPHTDKWYRQIFDPEKISGDITPAYHLLPEKSVAEIARRFPWLKIIILLRDPVERMWSFMRMVLGKQQGHQLEDFTEQELVDFAKRQMDQKPSYLACISRWQRYFDQVIVKYNDEIREDPQSCMADILHFLGLENTPALPDQTLTKIRHKGHYWPFPETLRRSLIQLYLPRVEELTAHTASPYPQKWLQKYQQLLAQTPQKH